MYKAKIDIHNQQFVIIDDEGDLVTARSMPYQSTPNPGKDVLMAHEDNKAAYEKIAALVEAANRLIGIENPMWDSIQREQLKQMKEEMKEERHD